MLPTILLFSTAVAFASGDSCPDFAGQYGVTSVTDANGTRAVDPSQVKIEVAQNRCAEVTITQDQELSPDQKIVFRALTDGTPTLLFARPEDSDGPEEYTSFKFAGPVLSGEILYLYEGNSNLVDTGAAFTFELDANGNLVEKLHDPSGQGGMTTVLSYTTRKDF